MISNGVYTALITPFLSNGQIDEEGFLQLLERQIQAKVQGIVLLGSTGETPTLTKEEKKRLIFLAQNAIKAPFKLIIGTGTHSTTATIEETQLAEKMGADAALIVTPYYNKPTQEGLVFHYQAIAQNTSLPFLLYNVPGRTGVNLLPSTIKRLIEIPSILGIKEASGNLNQIADIIDLASQIRPDFKVFSGDDPLNLPILSLGAQGMISALSNLTPELILESYQLCIHNHYHEARSLHYKLLPLFKGAFIETNPIALKALMNFSDLPAGPCRLPLCSLNPENEKYLRHIHETIKLSLLQVKAIIS